MSKLIIAISAALAIGSSACNKNKTDVAQNEAEKIEPQLSTIEPKPPESEAELPVVEGETIEQVEELDVVEEKPEEKAQESAPVEPEAKAKPARKPVAKSQSKRKPIQIAQISTEENVGTPVVESQADATVAASVVAPSEGHFTAYLGSAHMVGTKEADRAVTEFQAELAYQLPNKSKVGVGATAGKLYEIEAEGEDEFLMDDPIVFFRSRAYEGLAETEMSWMTGITIPVSNASENSENITRVTLSGDVSRSFGRFKLILNPYARYYFNRYVSGDGIKPSQLASLNGLAVAKFAIIRGSLDLVGWGVTGVSYYEQYDDRDARPEPTSGSAYGAYLDLAVTSAVSLQGGWLYGNSLLGDALYSAGNSFGDPSTHRVYAGIGITL